VTPSLVREDRVEVDAMASTAWYDRIAEFKDANLYQVWHDSASGGRFGSADRVALTRGGDVVGAAEVRLMRFPLIRGGIAYVLWGPLSRRGEDSNPAAFRQAVRALREEYVVRRGMVLRINPRLVVEEDGACIQALVDEGFSPVTHLRATHSLLVDLTPELDELRRDLDKKWRNCLSKAERSGLTIASGAGLELFDDFITVYERMLARKQFTPSADIRKHRQLQQSLPAHLQMQMVIAYQDGRPCAGAIYSAVGDTAVYLFGATDEQGMQTSAAYLVQWTIVQALKASGVRRYDLNGVDPERNPGTYHFKRGLGGKKGIPVTFAGQFQAVNLSLGNYSLLVAERIRAAIRLARAERAVAATAQ
jgi:hypothetical protein